MRIRYILCLTAPVALLTAAATPTRIATAPFDAIRLQGSDVVEIVRGPIEVVVTEADPRTLSQLSVEAVGGVLRIGRKPGMCGVPGVCTGAAHLRVSMPQLSRLVLQGSGSLHGQGFGGHRLDAVVQGSGDIRLDRVEPEQMAVELDGSGVVELKGRTARLSVTANGTGTLDATRLDARDADVEMNGGGSVRARASGAATITANGRGTIRVDGTTNCQVTRRGRADIVCGRGG